MSFGQQAVVLEPEQLRHEMLAELQSLVAAYSPASSLPGGVVPARGRS